MAETKSEVSAAESNTGKKNLNSYTIKGINKVVRVGDCVMMRSPDTSKPLSVARIEKIESEGKNDIKVQVRRYYRPEEALGGRRVFHGKKELFLSDQYHVQSAQTIARKCFVHSLKSYKKLKNIGVKDYYSRFEYEVATGSLTPEEIAVYCTCEMPYNPDNLMVQCEECMGWYHPACVGMTIHEARMLKDFVCPECSEYDFKESKNGSQVSNVKGKPWRNFVA